MTNLFIGLEMVNSVTLLRILIGLILIFKLCLNRYNSKRLKVIKHT